jgi:cation diffusion facilitator CzcD-associated flavoprotein CzcO
MRRTGRERQRCRMREPTVIVIGAGAAGLAAAAELERVGVRAVVLEKAGAVGASWRSRYDRLRLNSDRWSSTLPRSPYPRGTGVFPSRDDVVDYLGAYAQRHGIDVRLGVEVERIDREGDRWAVRTSTGDLEADQVIVAGGYDHRPVVPAWPGREAFSGKLIHSAEYRSAADFRGQDVLVVGPGCSGADIAYDLLQGGAGRVRLAVRAAPNLLLRSPVGTTLASVFARLPVRRADAIMRFVQRRTIGDLSEFGLPASEEGVFTRLHRLHTSPTIIDPPFIEALRERRIEVVAGVLALEAGGVHLADGTLITPDAVIAATGYSCGLEPVVGHLGVLDERGGPRVLDGEAVAGLRFVGYIARPGPLGHFGAEARRAARAIARQSSRPVSFGPRIGPPEPGRRQEAGRPG